MANPKVSVLMCVYNGDKYLRKAIESILSQTFTDFEFLIINDGSKVSTAEILKEYQRQDTRIRLYHQENIGLTKSLKIGISMARGKYIARQDADDISLSNRLEVQLDEMRRRSSLIALGSWVDIINEDNKVNNSWRLLLTPQLARWRLLFGNTFVHGSMLFRRDSYENVGGYNLSIKKAQDYELWWRMSRIGDLDSVKRVLYLWRQHKSGLSSQFRKDQDDTVYTVMKRASEDLLGVSPGMDILQLTQDSSVSNTSPKLLFNLFDYFRKVLSAFEEKYSPNQFDRHLINIDFAERMRRIILKNCCGFRWDGVRLLKQVSKYSSRTFFSKSGLKSLVKCFI